MDPPQQLGQPPNDRSLRIFLDHLREIGCIDPLGHDEPSLEQAEAALLSQREERRNREARPRKSPVPKALKGSPALPQPVEDPVPRPTPDHLDESFGGIRAARAFHDEPSLR